MKMKWKMKNDGKMIKWENKNEKMKNEKWKMIHVIMLVYTLGKSHTNATSVPTRTDEKM